MHTLGIKLCNINGIDGVYLERSANWRISVIDTDGVQLAIRPRICGLL